MTTGSAATLCSSYGEVKLTRDLRRRDVQEEVGLKGARNFFLQDKPDFALAIDTTIAGDTPQIKETESSLKLGEGVAVTIIEASGRGFMYRESQGYDSFGRQENT